MPSRFQAAALALLLGSSPALLEAAEGSTIRIVPSPAPSTAPAPKPPPVPAPAPRAPPTAAAAPLPSRLPPAYAPSLEMERPDDDTMPWVGVGIGVALAAAGTVFAFEVSNALDEQSLDVNVNGNRATLSKAFREAQGRVVTNTIASTVLLSAAVSALVLSVPELLD